MASPSSLAAAGTPMKPTGASPADQFRQGIKRDKSHYKELKDERYWVEWKRSLFATAKAHGCEDVLNPHSIPQNPEEEEVFKEK